MPASASAKARGGGEAIGWELLERGGHRGIHLVGDGLPQFGDRSCLGRHHLGDDGLGGGPGEGRLAHQHLVGHAAEGVDIAAGPDLPLAHRLLGRHVVGRAEAHAGFGHPGAARGAGCQRDAEVGYQCAPVVQQDVLGLDVAMDHAVAVGVVEGGGHLGRDPDSIAHRELLFAVEPVAERFAFDVRHDVEDGPVHFARIEQRQDVRMLEGRGGFDLLEESLGADHGRQFGPEHFDGHFPAVAEVVGQVDGGHPALAELALDPVAVGQGGSEAVDLRSLLHPRRQIGEPMLHQHHGLPGSPASALLLREQERAPPRLH